METVPKIEVAYDYDGYFEAFIRDLFNKKEGPFKHHTVVIDAGPWRTWNVKFESKQGVLYLDFYSPARFHPQILNDHETKQLVEIL